jgi:hypothetical protein
MAILKRPKRVNEVVRPKLGSVASILAQSKIVADAFGRWPGFVLMIVALLVFMSISLAATTVALASLAKLWP